MRNQALPGTIEIEKEATPQGAQAFAFTGSPGRSRSRSSTGGRDSSSRIFAGLAPGTYTVHRGGPGELGAHGRHLHRPRRRDHRSPGGYHARCPKAPSSARTATHGSTRRCRPSPRCRQYRLSPPAPPCRRRRRPAGRLVLHDAQHRQDGAARRPRRPADPLHRDGDEHRDGRRDRRAGHRCPARGRRAGLAPVEPRHARRPRAGPLAGRARSPPGSRAPSAAASGSRRVPPASSATSPTRTRSTPSS